MRNRPSLKYRGLLGSELVGSFERDQLHPLESHSQHETITICIGAPRQRLEGSNELVCTGSPFEARSSNRLNSFLAIKELGYVCWSAPRLLTTSSAEYGLFIPLYLGDDHQSLTCCICCSYSASSVDPALELSGSNWYESAGSAEDIGGSTGLSEEGDIRTTDVDMYRVHVT